MKMKYNFSGIIYHVLGYWIWFAEINDSTPLLREQESLMKYPLYFSDMLDLIRGPVCESAEDQDFCEEHIQQAEQQSCQRRFDLDTKTPSYIVSKLTRQKNCDHTSFAFFFTVSKQSLQIVYPLAAIFCQFSMLSINQWFSTFFSEKINPGRF